MAASLPKLPHNFLPTGEAGWGFPKNPIKTMQKYPIICLMLLAVLAACGSKNRKAAQAEETQAEAMGPQFSADSAYAYCAAQCAFGPRTMNSAAHDSCGSWIAATFRRHGLSVATQQATLKGYDGTPLRATNIIASYRPEAKERVLLCAHWDSRPWADNDPDSANWHKPVMAANDGASGVAVLLELARIIGGQDSLAIGVDFVCFDAEDWGVPQWSDAPDNGDSWALGSNHWAEDAAGRGYKARFGILLDMVAGRGSVFHKEQYSVQYASTQVDKIWKEASDIGYGSYFIPRRGCTVTDDHYFVNEYTGIPCVDIIAYTPENCFPPYWHTLGDNIDNIDKNTMKAVGATVLSVIYKE